MGRQTTRKPSSTQSQYLSTIRRQPLAGALPEYCSEHHKVPIAISSSTPCSARETSGSAARSQGGTPCSCSQVFKARECSPAANRTRSPPRLVDTRIGDGGFFEVADEGASTNCNRELPHFISRPGNRSSDDSGALTFGTR